MPRALPFHKGLGRLDPAYLLAKADQVADLELSEFRFLRELQEGLIYYVQDVIRGVAFGVSAKFGVNPSKFRKSYGITEQELLKGLEDPWRVPDLVKGILDDIRRQFEPIKGYYEKYKFAGHSEVEPLRIKGKTLNNPETGLPMTVGEWQEIEDSITEYLGEYLDGMDEETVVRAGLLGLLRRRMQADGLSEEEQKGLSNDDVVERYGKTPTSFEEADLPADSVTRRTLEWAQTRAGEYLSIKDGEIKNRVVRGVRKIVEGSLKEGLSPDEMARRLFYIDAEDDLGLPYNKDTVDSINRDWRRVAMWETSYAMNNGYIAALLDEAEPGEAVYSVYAGRYNPQESEDEPCNKWLGMIVRVLPGPLKGGSDKIDDPYAKFAVWPGKTTVGQRKRDQWIAIPSHPHCTHYYEQIFPGEGETVDRKGAERTPQEQTVIREVKSRVSGSLSLVKGGEPSKKAWAVYWADHRAVQFFEKEEDAWHFYRSCLRQGQSTHDTSKPKQVEVPRHPKPYQKGRIHSKKQATGRSYRVNKGPVDLKASEVDVSSLLATLSHREPNLLCKTPKEIVDLAKSSYRTYSAYLEDQPTEDILVDLRVRLEDLRKARIHRDEPFSPEDYKAGSVEVHVPGDVWRRVQWLQGVISERQPDVLDGMDAPLEGSPHITLLYGVQAADLSKVRKVVNQLRGKVSLRVGGLGYFDNPEATVAYLKVESDELQRLHRSLRSAVPNQQREGDYIPHVTVAYLKPGARLDGIQEDGTDPIEWSTDTVYVSDGKGNHYDVLTESGDYAVCLNCGQRYYFVGPRVDTQEVSMRSGQLCDWCGFENPMPSQEELVKARAGLIPQRVEVKGPHGTHHAIRWVRPGVFEAAAAEMKPRTDVPEEEKLYSGNLVPGAIFRKYPKLKDIMQRSQYPYEYLSSSRTIFDEGAGRTVSIVEYTGIHPDLWTRLQNDYEAGFRMWRSSNAAERSKVPFPEQLLAKYPDLKKSLVRLDDGSKAWRTIANFLRRNRYAYSGDTEKKRAVVDQLDKDIAGWRVPDPKNPGYVVSPVENDSGYARECYQIAAAGKIERLTATKAEMPNLRGFGLLGRRMGEDEKKEVDAAVGDIASMIPTVNDHAKATGLHLKVLRLGNRKYLGRYIDKGVAPGGDIARMIEFDPKYSTSLAHEVGHWVDWTMRARTSKGFRDLIKAIQQTDYVERLHALGNAWYKEDPKEASFQSAMLKIKKLYMPGSASIGWEMERDIVLADWPEFSKTLKRLQEDPNFTDEEVGALRHKWESRRLSLGPMTGMTARASASQRLDIRGFYRGVIKDNKKHLEYLLKNEEVWARCFEQYMSWKNRGTESRAWKDYDGELVKRSVYFTDAEFEHIGPLVKAVVDEVGGEGFMKSLLLLLGGSEPRVVIPVGRTDGFRRATGISTTAMEPVFAPHAIHRDLLKARAGLVQRRVQVKGPKGVYYATRWLRPGEEVSPGHRADAKYRRDRVEAWTMEEQFGGPLDPKLLLEQFPVLRASMEDAAVPGRGVEGIEQYLHPELHRRLRDDYDLAFEVWRASRPDEREQVPSPKELLDSSPSLGSVISEMPSDFSLSEDFLRGSLKMLSFQRDAVQSNPAQARFAFAGYEGKWKVPNHSPGPGYEGATIEVPMEDYEYHGRLWKEAQARRKTKEVEEFSKYAHLKNYDFSGRRLREEEARQVDEAIGNVSEVVPEVDKLARNNHLNIRVKDLGIEYYQGRYLRVPGDEGDPHRIIELDSARYTTTLVHEMGHFLDDVLGSRALVTMAGGGPEVTRAWMMVVSACKTVGAWERWGEQEGMASEYEKYSDYLRMPSEIFARVFEQYVASRRKGKPSKAHRPYEELVKNPGQLTDEEFEQVAPRFKALMELAGGEGFVKSLVSWIGNLLKAKQVWVPPTGKRRGYFRFDPRAKTATVVLREEEPPKPPERPDLPSEAEKRPFKEGEHAKIVDIISVVDTREWEEGEDDKWHPIPGSGTENLCARCGKPHEIHATVRLEDDTEAVVGVSCAREPSLQKEMKRLISSAKTEKRLRAQLKAIQETKAAWEEEWKRVEKLEPPPMGVREERGDYGSTRTVMTMGEVKIWSHEGVTEERKQYLIDSWRATQMGASGFAGPRYELVRKEDIIEAKLAKLERRKKMEKSFAGRVAASVLDFFEKAAPGPGLVKVKVPLKRGGSAYRWVSQDAPEPVEKPRGGVDEIVGAVSKENWGPDLRAAIKKLSGPGAAVLLNNLPEIAEKIAKKAGLERRQVLLRIQVNVNPALIASAALHGGLSDFRRQAPEIAKETGAKAFDLDTREVATMADPTSSKEDLWYAVMGAWGSSSNKEASILLQEAIRDELHGGEGFIWQAHRPTYAKDLELRQEVQNAKTRFELYQGVLDKGTYEAAYPPMTREQVMGHRDDAKAKLGEAEKRLRDFREGGRVRDYETPPENLKKLREVVREKYERTQEVLQSWVGEEEMDEYEKQGLVSNFVDANLVELGFKSGRLSNFYVKAILKVKMAALGHSRERKYLFGSDSDVEDILMRHVGKARSELGASEEDYKTVFSELKRRIIEGRAKREIWLYRGVSSQVNVHNVAESWSLRKKVAETFDGYEILSESVPRKRVFAFFGTDSKLKANEAGYQEGEFIVLAEEPQA